MKTLQQWNEAIWATNRITNDATRKEIIEALDIIANDMLNGLTTLAHANTLLALRHALQNPAERDADHSDNMTSLNQAASALGSKGGSVVSDAKKKAAVERNAKRKAEGKPQGGRTDRATQAEELALMIWSDDEDSGLQLSPGGITRLYSWQGRSGWVAQESGWQFSKGSPTFDAIKAAKSLDEALAIIANAY